MEKNILFYSNLCQFSMDVINEITKKDIRSEFVFVSIDTNRHRIPPFVDRVPFIVNAAKEMFVDDNIHEFIQTVYMSKTSSQQAEVSPYSNLEMGSKFSDNFSYLGEDGVENAEHTFAFVSQDVLIHTPQEDAGSTVGGRSKIDPSVFEQFKAQRDSEYSQVVPPQQGSMPPPRR